MTLFMTNEYPPRYISVSGCEMRRVGPAWALFNEEGAQVDTDAYRTRLANRHGFVIEGSEG